MKNDMVFVYGTLRKGERADLSKHSHQFCVDFISPDAINGSLYHLGAFPGVKIPDGLVGFDGSKPVVRGETFRIRDASIMVLLDHYEGYPTLYDRMKVTTERGREAWVYTYNPPVHPEQLIPSGDWKNSDKVVEMAHRGVIR
jgi:gamma-glutamylcyclotransferase (GGCT)/AIG2-like uncharacterized protein YtfP